MLLDRPDPALEDLDPLVELLVGELEKRPGLPGLPVEVLAILGVTPIDVRVETLGEEPDVLSKVFDEHTRVTPDVRDLSSDIGPEAGEVLLERHLARTELGEVLLERHLARTELGNVLLEVRPDVPDLSLETGRGVGDLLAEGGLDVGDLVPEPLGGRGDQPLDLGE